MAAPFMALSDYLADLRFILHDPNDNYVSQADKIIQINRAIEQRDLDTGGNRALTTYTMVAGTDTYTFATLFVTANPKCFDVVNIFLLLNGLRIRLDEVSYTRLNAPMNDGRGGWRMNTTLRSNPMAYARYGAATIVFGPKPSLAYSLELDCVQYSTQLAATSDVDDLPSPWTKPVPWYAAFLCKVNMRQYDEATRQFWDEYMHQVSVVPGCRVGQIPSTYPVAYGGR